ncbi:hypothetical protein [Aliikangiella coralliicola]|uniref:Uncharacterized protein n=1 Tax=Aliikangiella coralliicola TaxID=2592383 RepID=A0A545UHF0_9GAMM|nr:hypothetical protein [Aliikangiella coralliicola]TQV88892.1 hypothetical protein FLL46_04985 [Aliikangiella coralliicola]
MKNRLNFHIIFFIIGAVGGFNQLSFASTKINNDQSTSVNAEATKLAHTHLLGKDKFLKIEDMGLHSVKHGEVFRFQPKITGKVSICRKDLGHDDVFVDSETGKISWDTSKLAFGRGFHIRIKCSNNAGSTYASMVVHVDKSGKSKLRVAGKNGVSPYIGVAGKEMKSGDTIVFPDGVYPVSVQKKYQNAFKRSAPKKGTEEQFSTLIAQHPGGAIVSGAPYGKWPKQKNAFQFSETHFVAIVGFVIENVQRSGFTTIAPGNRLLIDFVGVAGAGTWMQPCSDFEKSQTGKCSNAGLRVNGGTPLIQNSYDWGHNRYGIMTRSTSGSITRRSFVRLDEHKGDQPYGGFSNYCDEAHLSQDNTVFDSLAIGAPHYKHYAGLEAYPATGCERLNAKLKTEGLLAVNNKLSLSLMDQKEGPVHQWSHIVSYDSQGTCTPQRNFCGNWLLQADKLTKVSNSFFGKARSFGGIENKSTAFDNKDVVLDDSVTLWDIPGVASRGEVPRYLPQPLMYYRGRSDTFYGDEGYDQVTNVRRWPIGGEDIIAAQMRSYDNPKAFKVGGGEVHIKGNRGAVAKGDSMSAYFWSYIDKKIPPLAVRVKNKGKYHRVSWEPFVTKRQALVKQWKVVCLTGKEQVLTQLQADQLVYQSKSTQCQDYAVKAVYEGGESGIAYIEKPL